ncbi:MAG: N-acetylglucosamine-6-phosphate deacetylase [Hyphomicrobiaceae bacterium]|nr:N-acetylglucosamine-6-phosphate deacetylase [Hyphomicrobiaceae bacterium]
MAEHAFIAARVFDGTDWHDNAAVTVDGGKVGEVVPKSRLKSGIDTTDLGDVSMVPGFVDLQVNGGGGVLLNNEPSVSGIETICAAHRGLGTTALFPTLITDTPEHTSRAIAAAIAAHQKGVQGFAGLHVEGPHLSLARKGAHDPNLIRPMNDDDLRRLIEARPHLPALMTTVAAENVTPDQVSALAEADILVSIGHSDADYDSVVRLAEVGATMVTHLFNAMSQIGNRQPGLVGATLDLGTLNAGIIVDGFHVHPASVGIALRAKRAPGRIFLVSDAMSPAGTDIQELELNGRTILRRDGRLTLTDGTLAGADLDLAQAVRVLTSKVGVELGEALRMASTFPAEIAGLDGYGALRPGFRADMTILDAELQVQGTVVGGRSQGLFPV